MPYEHPSRNLEVQVRSGVMADTEERRTLREIDDAKRIREVIESFQVDSDAIDAEHAAMEKLKERLDDPEAMAFSERYYALEAEMNEMKRKVDMFGNPSLLFEQQRKLQRQINTLFSERYDLISRPSKDDTQHYATLNEDRNQRAERKERKSARQHSKVSASPPAPPYSPNPTFLFR
jgi:hypothetical protein